MDLRLKPTIIGLLIIVGGCAGPQPSTQLNNSPSTDTDRLLSYQDEIEVNFLKKHLSAFAADSMEGRETGTEGLEKAADYLVSQYSEMGLQPFGGDDTYFQKFKLNATVNDSIIFETYAVDGKEKKLVSRSVASKNSTADYIQQFGSEDTLSGEIVFAGFGVQNKALSITHLQGADLKGKWVMIFEDVPQVVNGDTLYKDRRAFSRSWLENILQRGPEGILMIPNMTMKEYKETANSNSRNFGEATDMQLAYRPQNNRESSWGYNMINPAKAARLLGEDTVKGLQARKEEIMDNMTEFSVSEMRYSLKQTSYTTDVTIGTQNVAAYHEGADPELKDEVVVMTSHYDHVGIGQPDSTGDRIYNGADDDGSGTIGLLNAARAFAEAGKDGVKPKRSILFLHVSAEEKGLLGSRYYSDHPIFPMEKTVANINTDMIGRIDEEHAKRGVEDYTYIIGSEIISSELDSLIRVANKQSGQVELNKRYNDLDDPNQFYRRSDHWHFGRKGVPFAFFFTGVHEDYHRPSDEVHKIRFEKMAKIVRTMYTSAVIIANTDNPPTVDNQEFIEITKRDN